jgi:hypothetical protein
MTTKDKLLSLRAIAGTSQPNTMERAFVADALNDPTLASFFFRSANNDNWIPELKGELAKCKDSRSPHHYYPYLFRLAELKTDTFIELINSFRDVFDYYGYIQIINIATRLDIDNALKLQTAIVSYLNRPGQKSMGNIAAYIRHISQSDEGMNACLRIIPELIAFKHRPNTTANSSDARTQVATPLIDSSAYREVLQDTIEPLASKNPIAISKLLAKTVNDMLCLTYPDSKPDEGWRNDLSEIWCKRLGVSGDYEDAKASLVNSLVRSCDMAFNKDQYSELDDELRQYSWQVFKRLRHHLYAKYPRQEAIDSIRELILQHGDYGQSEHHYEFPKLVEAACEKFGSALLTKSEWSKIFDAILNGPPKEIFREWMGERFTEEGFRQRQDHFHRMQLHPFRQVLFGTYRAHYDTLVARAGRKPKDDDYAPVSMSRGGFVSYRSPVSDQELAKLSDDDLLSLINTWNEPHRDPDNWLVEINISALAGAFATVLRTHVFCDDARLAFWLTKRAQIKRPIYVRFLLEALQNEIKVGNFNRLNSAFELCRWILSFPDEPNAIDTAPRRNEESIEYPDWNPVRRAVADFVGACVASDARTPITAKADLASLLATLCTQTDHRLDNNKPILIGRREPLTEAINNTRSRAIEHAIDFGFWVHRQTQPVPEVGLILDQRLRVAESLPLTLPEYALLGAQFNRLTVLDNAWSVANKSTLFPQINTEAWTAAFGSHLHYSNPFVRSFDILRDDYSFALDHFDPADDDETGRGWGDSLGQHLFTFYVWDLYPLNGPSSLLERFYRKTAGHNKRWLHLFDHIGRSLRNTHEDLAAELKKRIHAFVDWRLAQRNREELSAFTFWLEAKCLDARWRLTTFSKILDVTSGEDVGTSIKLDALAELLPEHSDSVVECFTKLLKGLDLDDFVYIQTEKAKPILQVGTGSSNEKIRKLAEEARELLLRAARFEFLDN